MFNFSINKWFGTHRRKKIVSCFWLPRTTHKCSHIRLFPSDFGGISLCCPPSAITSEGLVLINLGWGASSHYWFRQVLLQDQIAPQPTLFQARGILVFLEQENSSQLYWVSWIIYAVFKVYQQLGNWFKFILHFNCN